MTRLPAWLSGMTWPPSQQRKEICSLSSNFCTRRPREVSEHVADSRGVAEADHGDGDRCGTRPMLRAGAAADTHRHSSRLGSAGDLRCAALWRYEPAANGRIPLLLLRISLPLYQR